MSGSTPFSRDAWDQNTSTYEIIRAMPFNAELAAGTLERGALQALHHAGRALSHRLRPRSRSRPPRRRTRPDRAVRQFRGGSDRGRAALHGLVLRAIRHHLQPCRHAALSPACHHYVSYLLATAHAEPYEVLLGALLPASGLCRGRAISTPAQRQSIRIGPGSTPMRAKTSRRRPRRDRRHGRSR